SLRRSTSAPRYQPVFCENEFKAWRLASPVSSLASISACLRIDLRASERCPGLDCFDQTTAITVPARLSQASDATPLFSRPSSSGLDALPQPIWEAAGHTKGTS